MEVSMKSIKTITVTLFIAFGLTGCYTQLQYSQGVSKAADEGYYQDEEETYSGYEDEGYIPVYYKDYDRVNWWSSCCSLYTGYSFGTSYYYNDPWYDSYSRFHYGYTGFHSPFYFSSPWKWRHFGLGFHHNFFAMNLYWGSPFYSYSGFLYGPWTGYYHHRPYWYGHGYYYGHNGSDSTIRSRSYRPRSIGTNRVTNSNNRGEERTRSVTRNSSSTQARGIRSSGSTRNRGAVQQGTTRVQQPRTRGTNRSGVQTRSNSGSNERSRGTVQERSQSKSTSSGSIRTRGTQRVNRDTPQRSSSTGVSGRRGIELQPPRKATPARVNQSSSAIRFRIGQQRVAKPEVKSSSSNKNDRTSFFGRVKKIFDSSSTRNNSIRINRSRNNNSSVKSNNIFRQRTRSRSTGISKPKSTNKSSITRSRSSSSPRSRGTSSSRSSSSRSRGN